MSEYQTPPSPSASNASDPVANPFSVHSNLESPSLYAQVTPAVDISSNLVPIPISHAPDIGRASIVYSNGISSASVSLNIRMADSSFISPDANDDDKNPVSNFNKGRDTSGIFP